MTAPALGELVRAGLVLAADDEESRRARRDRCHVHLDVPGAVLPAALRLLGELGLRTTRDPGAAAVALVWSEGELPRDRVDEWIRAGTPHLVVSEAYGGPRLGPYVVPGATACLRCVDAHAGEPDPRRALVVEQVASTPPLRPTEPDPARRALVLAWAAHDLATAAEGGVPVTWSATVALGVLPPVVTAYHRHLHCGCAWADERPTRSPGQVERPTPTSTRCPASPPSRAGAHASRSRSRSGSGRSRRRCSRSASSRRRPPPAAEVADPHGANLRCVGLWRSPGKNAACAPRATQRRRAGK